MSPLFTRVTSHKRERFLHQIYRLAAQKVLMETSRTDAENQARQLAQEAEAVESESAQIQPALRGLFAALDAQPQESPERSEELEGIVSEMRDLEQRQEARRQALIRAANELQNLEGKDVTVSSDASSSLQYAVRINEVAPEQLLDSYIQSITNSPATAALRYRLGSGRKPTVIDHWLISAIDKSLPTAPPRKRSRFNRDEVTRMTFEAAFGETLRTVDGSKSARQRKR
jgi:small-conductance mechanosensitive channel